MADRVGQQFGDYRLIRLIGKGGFADVYLGEHMRRKGLAAVKVLHARLANDNVKSFLNEARSFRLKHPHIIQILDFGLEDDFPYLVMDYAPNGSLRQRHPKGTQLPLATIIAYVQQIAAALQYAHEEGVIHRDIKPDNMLLRPNNEVLLSDFGIASIAHTTHSLDVQNQAGTISYMAPEQLQGKPRPASDQYALGVVVYEWICGDRPFQGTFIEIHSQHLSTPPPELRERVPSLPSAVEEVLMTALAKDPRHRFGSVRAFANALEQAYLVVNAPNPTLKETVQIPAKPEAPPAAKIIRQLPTQHPLIVPAGFVPARPVLDSNPAIEITPDKDVLTPGENRPQGINPPTPLPPVMDYTPTTAKPTQETVPIPVASPDTYTADHSTGTKPVSVPRRKSKRRWFIVVALVILILLVVTGAIFITSAGAGASISMATVTITPKSKTVADNIEIRAVTGKPDPQAQEVQARVLTYSSPSLPPQSATARATGEIPGQRATGTLTFINTGSGSIQIQGQTLTGKSGVPISFAGPITVPIGSITVLGTAVNVGASGNIPYEDIFQSCCASGILVRNFTAFSGGKDPIPIGVIQQADITSATNALIDSLKPTAQAQLQSQVKKQVKKNEQVVANSLSCTSNVTANHRVGDQAKSVTVTGTVTCTEEVFDLQGAFALASKALMVDAAKDPGAGYVLVGNIVEGLGQPPPMVGSKGTITLVVHAEAVWAYQLTDGSRQLENAIANKSKNDAQNYLLAIAGISSIKMDLSDGNKLPDASHITIVVKAIPGATGPPATSPGSPTSGTTRTTTPGSPTSGTTPTSVPAITPSTGLGGS